MGDNVYFYLWELVTIRKNYIVGESTVSLDISYYLGKVDYELEAESEKEMVLPTLVLGSIETKNHNNGKYTRFIKRNGVGLLRYEKKIHEIVASIIKTYVDYWCFWSNSNLCNIGINFISFVSIVVAIENEFGIEFSDDRLLITEYRTISLLN